MMAILLIGYSSMIYIRHQIKKEFLFSKEESVKILDHKFNPKESVVEIESTGNGIRIKKPEEIITEVAKEEKFKDVDLLINLCACESSLGERMLNSKGNKPVGSKDRGWFQINSYWHKEITDEQAFDLRFATKFTINLINRGQLNQFVCAKYIK